MRVGIDIGVAEEFRVEALAGLGAVGTLSCRLSAEGAVEGFAAGFAAGESLGGAVIKAGFGLAEFSFCFSFFLAVNCLAHSRFGECCVLVVEGVTAGCDGLAALSWCLFAAGTVKTSESAIAQKVERLELSGFMSFKPPGYLFGVEVKSRTHGPSCNIESLIQVLRTG